MKLTTRISVFITVVTLYVVTFISSAFAAEGTSADVTDQVKVMETEHKWFYWPGWAFAGLTFLVIALVLFSWYKLVLEPKYRGRKVAQS